MRGRYRAPVRNAGKGGLDAWEALYGGEKPPPRNGKGSDRSLVESEPEVKQKQEHTNFARVPDTRQDARLKFGAPSRLVERLPAGEAESVPSAGGAV